MRFFQTIKNSIYAPSFYQQIPSRSFKGSLGYFLLLILFLTIISTITLLPTMLFEVPAILQQFLNDAVACFPDELKLSINRGKVTTNVAEPYFVPFCLGEQTSQDYNNLLVIDTQTPFSSSQFNQYQTVAWLTKDTLVYKERDYKIQIFDLSQIPEFKLDRATINSLAQKISPWLKFVGPALLLVILLGLYIMYIFRLMYALFLALVIFLSAKVFKKTLTYKASYKISLYAMTLPLLVELAVHSTSKWTNFDGFPFMFTAVTLGVVFFNYLKPALFLRR